MDLAEIDPASEGENGISKLSPRLGRRLFDAPEVRVRRDLVSGNIKRSRFPAQTRKLWSEFDQSAFAAYIRRKSGFLPWILAFCFVGAHIQVADFVRGEADFRPTSQDQVVERMAKEAVRRSLQVVGHGATVSSTSVRPIELIAIAQYSRGDKSIKFAAGQFFDADQMLHTAAHESVHVIFDKAELNPYSASPVWGTRLLVEETTAEVLGAHIAGRVRTRSGGDGETFTRTLIAEYRRDCSSSPQGVRSRLQRLVDHFGVDKINYDAVNFIAIHYGSVEMVDAIDQICREYPDPWEAAHVVAERYIEPIDEPGTPAP